MAVLAGIVRDMLVVALRARCHMPAECFGSADFNGGHHFELRQADMSLVGLPPYRSILLENVSDLQLGRGQLAST